MKQALTETLAYFDENDQAFRMSDLRIYVAAARLVERLLPGVCNGCGGTGWFGASAMLCPECHGSGQVWDEGMLEVLEAALIPHVESPSLGARAVLSALVELLTEKVK